ncbi:MAG: GNAT family N-acetyltransferase [Firmicutes bacterium]|nr:GNAT family N-acetyltransferase [Bacillota bacterium]
MASFYGVHTARTLESGEARANRHLVEGQRRHNPHYEGAYLPVGQGGALYVQSGSPMNYAVGLGVFDESEDTLKSSLDALDAFYRPHHTTWNIEVASLASESFLALLGHYGYRAQAFGQMWIHPLDLAESPRIGVTVRELAPEEASLWASVTARGFADGADDDAGDEALFFGFTTLPGIHLYLAESSQGTPMGGAAMAVADGYAALFSGATLPEWRGRGVQTALLQKRLWDAKRWGAPFANVQTDSDTASAHNVAKVGFRLIYTKTTFQSPPL